MPPSHTDDLLAELPWLRRFAAGLVRGADAEDVVQDTLVEAMRAERPAGSPRRFMAGIARNLARGGWRRDARRREREERRAAEAPRSAAAADEDALRVDLLKVLLEELGTLPPAQRRAITGRFLDELEPAEIAARDGLSPASVRAQLSRGLASLRERLDRRSGGRGEWLGCLLPWVADAPAPTSFAPTGAGRDPSPTTPGALDAARTSSTLFAGLAGVAAMKLAIAFVVPALAIALWFAQRDPTPPRDGGGREVAATEPAGGALQPVDDGERRAGAPGATAASPGPASTARGAAVPAPAPEPRLVDRLTGEEVPHMRVELLCPGEPEGSGARVTSDARGRLDVPAGLTCTGAEVRVIERDETSDTARGPLRHGRAELPLAGPLEVEVGPTFRLALPPDLRDHPGHLRARFRAPGDTRSFDDPEATVRSTGAPWIRFPREVTRLAGADFEVVLEDRVAGRRARIPVQRTRGVEPTPLLPTFEATGAVRFVLEDASTAAPPSLKIDLEPLGHDVPEDVELRLLVADHGDDVSGGLDLLPPGDYAWVLIGGGTGAGGRVSVHAGETSEVALGADALGATFDSEVLIDATATPDADPTTWPVMVTSEDEAGAGMFTAPRAVEGSEGHFRIPLDGLAVGTWRVVVNAPAAVTLAPSSVRVTPGAPAETLRTVGTGATASLTLTVVDVESGRALTDATATVIVVPRDAFELTGVDERRSALSTDRLPADRPSEIFVRAPGFRGRLVEHDPARDPGQREIGLEPGWRSRALALDAGTLAPLAGVTVTVDGARAGATGADGWCWLEGDAPPERVALRLDDPDREVLVGPYDEQGEGLRIDPPAGFVFVVGRRER